MPSELTFRDYFSSFAGNYAAARPTYPQSLFEYIARHAPATERAWDCATGNGQTAIGLAGFFTEVCASDASKEQISHAMARDNVEYSVQLAEQTEYPDDYFDVVTVSQALHWFDLDRFAVEAARVLRADGLIFAWVYGFFTVDPAIDAVIDASIKAPIDSLWKRGNRVAKSGYRNLELPFPVLDLPAFKLACEWDLDELFAYIETWSALNRYIERHGDDILQSAYQAVGAAWGKPARRRTVMMDFYVRGWRNAYLAKT